MTGATGFLGSHFTQFLLSQTPHEVFAVIRSPAIPKKILSGADIERINWVQTADVPRFISEEIPDIVVHLATNYKKTHQLEDIPDLIRSNIEFGALLLESIDTTKTRLIYTSSFFQFLHGEVNPSSFYAVTKANFSEFVDFYRASRNLTATEVVLYDTYGADDTRGKLIPTLISSIRNNTSAKLGSSKQPINLTHVDDICSGLLSIVEATPKQITVTLRSPEIVTVGEIVVILNSLTSNKLSVEFLDQALVNQLPILAGDWATPDDWTPKVSLAAGLATCLPTV